MTFAMPKGVLSDGSILLERTFTSEPAVASGRPLVAGTGVSLCTPSLLLLEWALEFTWEPKGEPCRDQYRTGGPRRPYAR